MYFQGTFVALPGHFRGTSGALPGGGVVLQYSERMISFIVPAHNEEALIGRTLESIAAAGDTLDLDYEIVVAADTCSDRTVQIAEAAGARVVEVALRQISAVRNAGTRAARGELFIFVDADTVVPPEVVAATVLAIEGGAVGGGCRVRLEGLRYAGARFLAGLFIRIYRMSRLAAGCYVFATRKAFQAVGGFDERFFASEEVWISKALKRHGIFVVLKEEVLSSGRKISHLNAFQGLMLLTRYIFKARHGLRSREGLDLWYNEDRTPRASE